ncbi:MAG: nucleotidyltransferase family protein [Candidatus Rokubacteria bacterium]|nr:nucleotidyltransferase family protein [Candidatus Rokubacteria bacterium]
MIPPTVHPFLMGLLRGADPSMLLPLAPEDRDWQKIIGDAAAQGFTPLLYRWLKGSDAGRRLPAELADRLEAECFGLAARNLLLSSELAGILRAFEERRIPCAPLRGPALAERLYGDITARPMGDLDLLVRKEDLPEVAGILRSLGFREMDRRPGFAQAFSYTLKFFKDRHGWIIVEPHWTLAYPPFVGRVDMDEVWRRCVRGPVVGVESWVLGREELLLHLCLHLTHRDGTAPLLWSYELDRLVRLEGEGLDWSRVLTLARQAKVEFLLSRVLARVTALFATPIPGQVLGQLAGQPSRSVEGRLVRLLAGGAQVDGKESLAVFFALEGLGAKLRYAVALLFPSPAFMRIQYGVTRRGPLGLAYLRRCCRLGWESAKGVAKLLS